MEKINYWRLCDSLSIVQASLLVVGLEPDEYSNILIWRVEEYPENFYAAFTAISNAVLLNKFNVEIQYKKAWIESEYLDPGEKMLKETHQPDWENTLISVDELRRWLKSRGINKGFFFPQAEVAPDYLDQTHKYYAPKLAAAIEAWEAVRSDPDLIKGKTVKQALQKWLRKNADRFGLTKDDGNPNEQGIEEIAKIANWGSKGGAPKTPE